MRLQLSFALDLDVVRNRGLGDRRLISPRPTFPLPLLLLLLLLLGVETAQTGTGATTPRPSSFGITIKDDEIKLCSLPSLPSSDVAVFTVLL